MKKPLLKLTFLIAIILLFYPHISLGSVIEKDSLRPILSFSSTEEVPHRVANGIIEDLIKQRRLIEVSFEGDNEPIARIIETDENFTLPEDLRNKLRNVKTELDRSYNEFYKFKNIVEKNRYYKIPSESMFKSENEGITKPYLSFSLQGRYKNFCNSLLRSYANLNEESRLQKYRDNKEYIDKEFLELLNKARQAKINIVLGTAYISAREKIIAHARRGVTSENLGYACTIGEWLIEHLKTTEEVTNFILNEALHFGNTKPHGKIISPKDYDIVVEHGITDDPSLSYSYNLERTAVKATVDHGPWQPLYGDKIVGKSPAMLRLFKQIDAIKKSWKTRLVLIVGPTGSGKTTIAEAFTPQEYPYSLNAANLSLDMLVEYIQKANKTSGYIGDTSVRGTLIINNFENASTELQHILLECFDNNAIIDRNANSIPVNCRIVITTTQTTHLEDAFLSRLRGTTLKIPDRTEDIVLLAEYFNWELSMEYNIPWAPLDKFVGQILQDTKVAQEWKYDIRGIRSIMQEIIINRLQIFSGKITIKKLDDSYKHWRRYFLFWKAEKWRAMKKQDDLYEHWKRNLITMADFLLLKDDNPVSTRIQIIMGSGQLVKYNINSNEPYFEELRDIANLANIPKADSFSSSRGDEEAPDINFSYPTALESAL